MCELANVPNNHVIEIFWSINCGTVSSHQMWELNS